VEFSKDCTHTKPHIIFQKKTKEEKMKNLTEYQQDIVDEMKFDLYKFFEEYTSLHDSKIKVYFVAGNKLNVILENKYRVLDVNLKLKYDPYEPLFDEQLIDEFNNTSYNENINC
jgi:hypothetical protein